MPLFKRKKKKEKEDKQTDKETAQDNINQNWTVHQNNDRPQHTIFLPGVSFASKEHRAVFCEQGHSGVSETRFNTVNQAAFRKHDTKEITGNPNASFQIAGYLPGTSDITTELNRCKVAEYDATSNTRRRLGISSFSEHNATPQSPTAIIFDRATQAEAIPPHTYPVAGEVHGESLRIRSSRSQSSREKRALCNLPFYQDDNFPDRMPDSHSTDSLSSPCQLRNFISASSHKQQQEILVAAVDLGTAYSGYAFSSQQEQTNICTNTDWPGAYSSSRSVKTPTSILLDPNKEFHAFGYEAEEQYNTLAEQSEEQGWLLFRRFKMKLYNNVNLTEETMLEAVSGEKMPALTIFAMSIGYLKDRMLGELKLQDRRISEWQIRYVLTIPAIWNDKAKHFMRQAAVKAGINSDRLKLALEPEAASIWCQTLTTAQALSLSVPGAQYMIIDLGGGTADISVHETTKNGELKELRGPSGGPWGGDVVDDNFLTCFTEIFGDNVMDELKLKHAGLFLEILEEFESKKRSIKNGSEGSVKIRLPGELREIHEKLANKTLTEKIQDLGLDGYVTISYDKLFIKHSIIKKWFQDPISKITAHVQEIFSEPNMSEVNTILLVGAFSDSAFVQSKIEHYFPQKQIIVPQSPGVAVLKGAVLFGHRPNIVVSRVAKCTYGIEVNNEDFGRNSQEPLTQGGRFHVFVRKGEKVQNGLEVTHSAGIQEGQEMAYVAIYTSESSQPNFVREQGCQKIGTVEIRNPYGEDLQERSVDVTFHFGDTELLVSAISNSGSIYRATFNCL